MSAARGRVVLAMSGGVDSSASALLLAEQGWDVVGVFMRTGAHAEEADACDLDAEPTAKRKIRGCCSAVDAGDAQRVADRLNMPFYALNFEQDFNRIKDYFVDEYLHARTPNPCVVCNTWVKFGRLWEYADAISADWIATGHYAQIVATDDGPRLGRAVDRAKDQSYFLFGLPGRRLSQLIFPIGHLPKAEVRARAQKAGLSVASKPDSQEVCFVPDGDHQAFIRQRHPELVASGGEIVDTTTGRVVGEHDGISRYTIGQRKGLGVAMGTPHYVVGLEAATNRVLIGPSELLRRSELTADRVNWLLANPPTAPIECQVKIRYLHQPTSAVVEPLPGDRVRVVFTEPQTAVTPGQAVVFYHDDLVLGGAWIE